MILSIQIYLTNQWSPVRDAAIEVSLHGVKSCCGEFMAFSTDQGSKPSSRYSCSITPARTFFISGLKYRVSNLPFFT